MDKKTIDNIVWWIPFKNLRNAVREYMYEDLYFKKEIKQIYSNMQQENKLKIDDIFLLNNYKVIYGNFKDMNYIKISHGSALYPKLLGSYEEPIQHWIKNLENKNYDIILDIGCAEGYYAVGFAYKGFAKKQVIAYDINEEAIQSAKKLSDINNLKSEIIFKSLCDHKEIENVCLNNKALIFCDIEGAEYELLDPEKCTILKKVDMIIESHDCIVPNIINILIKRFQNTHSIEIASDYDKNINNYPVILKLNQEEQFKIISEGRPSGMLWIKLTVI